MNSTEKNSILIIDDEAFNLHLLTHILNREYTVYAIKDGQTGIEIAKKHRPDLILLDIIMPKIDGYEVLSALKKSPETQNIPVIIISGLDAGDEREDLLQAADRITKPFNSDTVKSVIKKHLQVINR